MDMLETHLQSAIKPTPDYQPTAYHTMSTSNDIVHLARPEVMFRMAQKSKGATRNFAIRC